MINVIAPNGKELEPTKRYDYIYKKLRRREAKVVRKIPFTVQILNFGKETYDNGDYSRKHTARA